MAIKVSKKGTGFSMVILNNYSIFNVSSSVCVDGLLCVFLVEFKYGKAPILIATDVASRGLGQYTSLPNFNS